MLVRIWGGLFCFIISNSICKIFHNKSLLYHLLGTTREHAGKAQCVHAAIRSFITAQGMLPHTHAEGCWLLTLHSAFTVLAVLKFNYFLT